jgi:hypothetical protein
MLDRMDAPHGLNRCLGPALSLLVFVVVLAPLLAATIPPLHDYPFHLARADAIAALLGQTGAPPGQSTDYRLGSFLLPNVGMDVVTLGLTAFMPPILAGRVFLGLVLVSLLSGTMALHRALHRRFSPWPLLAAFFLYNWIFLYGFNNYMFGVGMMLWGVAAWLAAGRTHFVLRILTGTVFAVIVLFCHLVAFGLFAEILGGLALAEAFTRWRETREPAIGTLLLPVIPVGVALAIFVALSPTAGQAREPIEYAGWFGWKPLMAYRTLLWSIPWLDFVTLGPIAVLVALAAYRRRLRLANAMIPTIALLLVTFVVMPYGLFGSLYADARLPIAILFVMIAAVDLRPLPSRTLVVGISLALVLLVARDAAIAREWHAEAPVIEAYRKAFDALPAGSTLYVASAEPFPKLAYASAAELVRWHPPLKHLASLASVGHDVFVPSTWADPYKQPIAVLPRRLAAKQLQGDNPFQTPTADKLGDVVARIQALRGAGATAPEFLLLLRPDVLAGTPPPGLVAVAHGGTFTIFRIE